MEIDRPGTTPEGSLVDAIDAPSPSAEPVIGFAQQWWDADRAKARFEERLYDLLGDDSFERIGGDDYDGSLEIREVANNIRLNAEAQRFIHGSGFSKVYVNHKDKWETHYTWDWKKPFEPVRGWRRKKTAKGFAISFWPAGWTGPGTKDWLSSGYMTVVPDPLEPPADGSEAVQLGASDASTGTPP